jgi:hypothetical protein
MGEFPVKTICGSMRYYEKMKEVAEKETTNGVIILMPFVYYNGGIKVPGDEFADMLDKMHKAKIDMSDAIIVVGTHIGESTQSEIDYAEKTGKAILFWTEHFGAIA